MFCFITDSSLGISKLDWLFIEQMATYESLQNAKTYLLATALTEKPRSKLTLGTPRQREMVCITDVSASRTWEYAIS